MQAVDVAKDVAAEREPAHHGLLLALGDWRPDWCMLSEEAKMHHLFSTSTVVLQFGGKRRQLQSFVSF